MSLVAGRIKPGLEIGRFISRFISHRQDGIENFAGVLGKHLQRPGESEAVKAGNKHCRANKKITVPPGSKSV